MCGAPCAALTGGCRRNATGFHFGRVLGYMAGGAAAAGSVALLGAWSDAAPALRPLWTLLHLALLALGAWWLVTGRRIPWMTREGAVPVRVIGRRARPLRSGVAGLAWIAWPCAALQGALLLAALASSPQGGALVMGAFALGSMPALAVGPWLWARWRAARGEVSAVAAGSVGFRIAGLGLLLASGWAVSHGVWERVAAWCAG